MIGWVVVALLAAVVIGAGSVFAVDNFRAGQEHPDPCGTTTLQAARGDLVTDEDVLTTAWQAASGRVEVNGDLGGSPLIVERSCVLFAGRGAEGDTVVFADPVESGRQTLLRVAEVRLPAGGGTPQRAVAAHSVVFGHELDAGLVLPLSGRYLAPGGPGEVTGATLLSAADGYTVPTPAQVVGDGLFQLGIAPDRTAPAGRQGPALDGALLLTGGGPAPLAVALPAGPESAEPLPVRAAYTLTLDGQVVREEAALRLIGQALSVMSRDPRYAVVRDLTGRPAALDVRNTAAGIVVTAADPRAAQLLFIQPAQVPL
jgi:hypothetical protein